MQPSRCTLHRAPGRNRHGKLDGENCTFAITPIIGVDGASHRRNEAAADGEPQAGTGALTITGANAVKLIEYAVDFRGRNSLAFIQDLDDNRLRSKSRAQEYPRPARGIFGGVVQKVEQDLFEKHRT